LTAISVVEKSAAKFYEKISELLHINTVGAALGQAESDNNKQ
jgi:hypothetical protein